MHTYKARASDYRRLLRALYPILCAVNRRHELYRLITWAKTKKLAGPLCLYKSRLADEEARILRYRMQNPHLVSLASLIHSLTYSVFPPPRYLKKDAAKAYGTERRRLISGKPIFSRRGSFVKTAQGKRELRPER
jgi:hypothetical protein